jgi:hypothetical protein
MPVRACDRMLASSMKWEPAIVAATVLAVAEVSRRLTGSTASSRNSIVRPTLFAAMLSLLVRLPRRDRLGDEAQVQSRRLDRLRSL